MDKGVGAAVSVKLLLVAGPRREYSICAEEAWPRVVFR